MKKLQPALTGASLLALTLGVAPVMAADSFTEALTSGTASGDFHLRYEGVDQDNALEDAEALTLRSRIGYKTGTFNGLSAMIEFEDSRIVGGVDDYTVGQTGFNPGEFSVIADPETTEVDQAFVQYKNDIFAAKLGRQVITFDNHRFIGHVGWRQDRQTFDGFTAALTPVEGLSLNYGYVDQRNRIFAEEADIESEDHLVNISYKTPFGTLTGYAYLLEIDNDTDNALDTYGVRFSGSTGSDELKFLYTLEFASQEAEAGSADADADYTFIEAGVDLGMIYGKLGYEVLGSDDGAYGFSTPLATLHKFNGWADQFLATPVEGLVDTYATIGGKLGKGKWAIVYHEFEADESSSTVDDLGDELNVVITQNFSKNYYAGIKYADYSAGDIKVDTEKLWLWVGAKF